MKTEKAKTPDLPRLTVRVGLCNLTRSIEKLADEEIVVKSKKAFYRLYKFGENLGIICGLTNAPAEKGTQKTIDTFLDGFYQHNNELQRLEFERDNSGRLWTLEEDEKWWVKMDAARAEMKTYLDKWA